MTYLSARKLVASPYLEIYENTGPTVPPVQLDIEPTLVAKAGAVSFSPDRQAMAVSSDMRIEEIPGAIGNPTNTNPTAGTFVYAPDDTHMLFYGTSTGAKVPAVYQQQGPFYKHVTTPLEALAYPFTAGAVNKKGMLIAAGTSESSVSLTKIYQKNPATGVWAFLTNKNLTGNAVPRRIEFIGDEYLLIVSDIGTYPGTSKLYKIEDNLPELALPVAGAVLCMRKISATKFKLIIRTAINAATIYELEGTTFTAQGTVTVTAGVPIVKADMTSDGDAWAVYMVNAGVEYNVRAFGWNGSAYVSTAALYPPGASGPSDGTLGGLLYSPDKQYLAVGYASSTAPYNKVALYKRGASASAPLTLVYNAALNSGTISAFSPNSGIAHFQGGVGHHRSTVSPYNEVTPLPFAPTLAATAVVDVKYSPTGRQVGYRSGGNFNGATQDGGGGYIDYAEMSGKFITLYDRSGDTFIERAYVRHIVGTKISDMVFSKTAKVLSYHCGTDDPARITGLGRFVYAIADKDASQFELKGTIYETGDLESKIAYSPAETHFVLSTLNDKAGDTFRLYKFAAAYVYTEEDEEPIMFGPCAYSYCETVLVAHGGEKPYSLFAVVADELIPQIVTVTDWDVESVFLAVGFTGDCQGVILVPPDKVITITDPTNPQPVDEEPVPPIVDTPGSDEDDDKIDIIEEPGKVDVIITPGDPGTPPTQIVVDNDDKTVTNLTYFPYTVQSVTFRTW